MQHSCTLKKALLTGLSFLFFFSNGQTYFNKAYPQGTRSYQVMEKDNMYFGVAQMIDNSNFSFFIRLLKTDLNGVLLSTKDFTDSLYNVYPSNLSSLEMTQDSGFITVITKTSLPYENGLLKFKDDLSIDWYRVPKADSLQRDFSQVKPTPDGGYIVTGYLYRNNMYETLLLKTDSAANPEWERFYQGAIGQSLQPFFVYNAPGGGYLVTGLEKDLADATTNDPFLLRTDSLGNVLWKRVLGSPGFDGLPSIGYYNDERIIAIYHQSTGYYISPATGYRYMQPVLTKLSDKNGSILQKNTLPFTGIDLFSWNLLVKDDMVIAVGEVLNEDTAKPGGASFGFTLAVDTSLNQKWFKTYSHRKASAQYDDASRLFDIRPTSDGGFICAGYHKKDDTLGTGRSGFHAWLLKLDSTGCEVPLCANQIGVVEVPLHTVGEVQVYPNPAGREFNVSVGGLQEGTVQLLDMRGVVLQEKRLENSEAVLPLDEVNNGLYLVRIFNGAMLLQTVKVSVVR